MILVETQGAETTHTNDTTSRPTGPEQNRPAGRQRWLEWLGWIAGLVLAGLTTLASAAHPPTTVTLAWNPSPDATVTGYRLYYGVAPEQYTNSIAVGNSTSCAVTGLVNGVTYYFATTAYNATGTESPFSNEVAYTVAFSRLQIAAQAGTGVVLTIEGATGHAYAIEATQDLVTWATIGTATPGTGGTTSFVDVNAGSFARRFYRLRDDSL